jgi:hypothetical protein
MEEHLERTKQHINKLILVAKIGGMFDSNRNQQEEISS